MLDYDAIVIGSGSGGLTAAAALSRGGQKVGVFEQSETLGGYSQSFSADGFQFSPGVHYIGGLGPGGRLRQIYEGLGVVDDLVFLQLNPEGYDQVVVGDRWFGIPEGAGNFEEKLCATFPTERAGIAHYFEIVNRIADELRWAVPPQSLAEAAKLPLRMPTTLRHGLRSLNRFLDDCTADPFLRAILSIQSGDHAMAPSRAPLALHAGLQSYYFDGACYPHKGAHMIPNALARQVRERGGEVHLGAEVERILFEKGRAIGVRLADGSELRAGLVVSNADPGVTWGRLVPDEYLGYRLRRRLRRMDYSLAALSLFLAVDMDLRGAGLDSGNIWYSETPDIDAAYRFAEDPDFYGSAPIPGLFFNATTLKDPSLRTDGLHTVEALALVRGTAFRPWQDTSPDERPERYRQVKESLTRQMFASIERFVPGLEERVVFQSLATPVTTERYLHATEGAIYGTEKTIGNLGPFGLPVRTHLPGLYQCGASTIAAGVNGVTRSGLAAAAAALDCSDDDLLTARGQELRIYPCEDPDAWPPELRPRPGGPVESASGQGA